MAERRSTLGVDVGGVIVAIVPGGADTSFFGSRPLETPATDGVFEALAALAAGPFQSRVHLVSKAGPKVAGNTRDWLFHHRFFERTGIDPGNLHFVRERRDKAPVCKRLGITHFVDDRLDVLACLESVPYRYLFGAAKGGVAKDGLSSATGPTAADPGLVTPVVTWAELTERLTDPGGGGVFGGTTEKDTRAARKARRRQPGPGGGGGLRPAR